MRELTEVARSGAVINGGTVAIPFRSNTARRRCSCCALSNRCLPANLTAEQTLRFENAAQRSRTLNAGEHLFRVGDPFQSLFTVHSGCFKTYSVDSGGREHVVNFYFPGEIIGTDAIYPEQYVSNAVALGESSVCTLPYRSISQFSQEMPELQAQLLRLLSREVFSMTSVAGDFTAEERLAAFLVMVAARHRAVGEGPTRLTLAMSRQDIANFLRLATETVSRVLARFQKNGLVKTDRRQIMLLDPAGLYEIAECMNPYARCGTPSRRPEAGAAGS